MKGWILVTGAARRIGRVIALDLAASGWDIIVHYNHSKSEARHVAEDIQKLGRSACLAEIDLSNAKAVAKLIPSLAEKIGLINGLVNNASLFERDEKDPDGSRHLAVNAEAPRILSKTFRDHLPNYESGVIINLLDALPPAPQFSAYGRSKIVLTELTLSMAKSFAPHVRVNGVAPTYVLPSAGQSEQAFREMAGDKVVSAEKVAHTVRNLVNTRGLTAQIATVAS